MSEKKKKPAFLSRHSDGQPFPVIPHGNKSQLPRALRQTSLSPTQNAKEITDYWKKKQKEKMTEEEKAQDDLITETLIEQEVEQREQERQKSVMQKLNDAITNAEKREKLKEHLKNEASDEDDNGYYAPNDVFG